LEFSAKAGCETGKNIKYISEVTKRSWKPVYIASLCISVPLLEEMVREITKRKVLSLHTDISIETGERLIIYPLEKAPEFF
jgi:hypothetical protein